jgi:hypothetical protein
VSREGGENERPDGRPPRGTCPSGLLYHGVVRPSPRVDPRPARPATLGVPFCVRGAPSCTSSAAHGIPERLHRQGQASPLRAPASRLLAHRPWSLTDRRIRPVGGTNDASSSFAFPEAGTAGEISSLRRCAASAGKARGVNGNAAARLASLGRRLRRLVSVRQTQRRQDTLEAQSHVAPRL